MRRILVFVAVAATVATLIAGPVAAQAEPNRSTFTGSFAFSTEHPCDSGVLVTLEGEIVITGQTVETPRGETITYYHERASGTGIDSEGNKYVINSLTLFQVEGSQDPPSTLATTFNIISQGSTDNFMVTAVEHINPNGEIFVQETNPICRG